MSMATRLRHGDAAWLALAAVVLVYELVAPKDELLSEACDRYRNRHPRGVFGLVAYLAGHLLRTWPPQLDALHQMARLANRVKDKRAAERLTKSGARTWGSKDV